MIMGNDDGRCLAEREFNILGREVLRLANVQLSCRVDLDISILTAHHFNVVDAGIREIGPQRLIWIVWLLRLVRWIRGWL